MGRSKNAWLDGPSDLREEVVEDVPRPGESVLVRGLPATYSNDAQSESLEMKVVGRDQVATVNSATLEILQFLHGVVEPQFTREEVEQISAKYGPAFSKVVAKIVELSAIDQEAIKASARKFPTSGASENGSDVDAGATAVSAGPDLPARAGAPTGDAGS